MQSIHIFHLADGLITRHRAIRHDLETMMQFGRWPPPTPTRAERAAADASAGGPTDDVTALDGSPGRT